MPTRAFVTGAAGFIGSHLIEKLLDSGFEVEGFDNLSSGDKANLARADENPCFRFVQGDLLDLEATRHALGEHELIFHLAADPEVSTGTEDPDSHLRQNLLATYNLLEALRRRRTLTRLVFASTSTVYGEPSAIPTPEDYGPLLPISVYGATKLGCEGLAASYTHLLPLKVVIFRLANIVGPRARHGVLHDFIAKLRGNPNELDVLGDGTQTKSYLHIDECLDAFLMTLDSSFWRDAVAVYNIGSEDKTNVLDIARMVTEAMGLRNVSIRTTKKLGGRAWTGDVGTMQLDTSKIKRLGWKAKRNSEEAVRAAVDELLRDLA